MIRLDILKKIEALQELNNDQLVKIQNISQVVEFTDGNRLFREGDAAEQIWFVVEGQVDLRFEMPDRRKTSTDHTVSSVDVPRFSVAQVLGWSCFVPPYKMRLSAYCVSPKCKIVRIDRESLLDLFKADTSMGYLFISYLIKVVGYRFHQFQDEFAKNMGEDIMSGW